MPALLKVEFHCHTIYSKDCLVPPEKLVKAARQAGVDRLIITDHNSIGGALRAQALDPELVIVGEELLTTRGELLCAFVKEELPRGLEPLDAIRRLRAQGAFISVSHPFDRRRHGWALDDLRMIAPLVDAIEVFNARCQLALLNQQAAAFASEAHLAGTAGSDAHTLGEVGRATVTLPYFSGAEELRSLIGQGIIQGKLSSPFIHLTSTYARFYKQLRGKNASDRNRSNPS
jgi:predicted metal-dependent phosphoesterase TrpH